MPDLSHLRRFLDEVTTDEVIVATSDLRELVEAVARSLPHAPALEAQA